jgi:hypothetical protein
MTKKTSAQLRRLQARAASRGEAYILNLPCPASHDDPDPKEESEGQQPVVKNSKPGKKRKLEEAHSDDVHHDEIEGESTKRRIEIARQLESALIKIEEAGATMKSKDRRSAKRKAEAIAREELLLLNRTEVTEAKIDEASDTLVDDLLQWYKLYRKTPTLSRPNDDKQKDVSDVKINQSRKASKRKKNPLIVFIGQLSYDTSAEMIVDHFFNELRKEVKDLRRTMIKVRLRTDPKTGKSLGTAFLEIVETENPLVLYSCLKLHQTFLHGRRINVERSSGGGAPKKEEKLRSFREEQSLHMKATVQKILDKYYSETKEIQPSELDEGVIGLCIRHCATVVQAALEKYVETNGRDKDNPSAYLSFLLTQLSTEGIFETSVGEGRKQASKIARKVPNH